MENGIKYNLPGGTLTVHLGRQEDNAVLTVSDCPLRGESLPAEQRQTSFTQMIEIALETAE